MQSTFNLWADSDNNKRPWATQNTIRDYKFPFFYESVKKTYKSELRIGFVEDQKRGARVQSDRVYWPCLIENQRQTQNNNNNENIAFVAVQKLPLKKVALSVVSCFV